MSCLFPYLLHTVSAFSNPPAQACRAGFRSRGKCCLFPSQNLNTYREVLPAVSYIVLFPTAELPTLVHVRHQPFHLCSPKQSMPPNISNISPDSMLHGEKKQTAQDPSFPSSSCSNSPFQVGMPYQIPRPPGKTTDMGKTQIFTLSFLNDQSDLSLGQRNSNFANPNQKICLMDTININWR